MPDGFIRRLLGRTGLHVNAMALGGYSMSSAYGDRDDATAIEVIYRAPDEGVDIFDTADFYGWGHVPVRPTLLPRSRLSIDCGPEISRNA